MCVILALFDICRQSVPVQFQYFLPTYPPSAYPLTAHTYTPITSSVSTIRQYPGKNSFGATCLTLCSVVSLCMCLSDGRSWEGFVLDSDNCLQELFDDLLPERKTHAQGALYYFCSLLNTADNRLFSQKFHFWYPGVWISLRTFWLYKSEQFNSSKPATLHIFIPWCFANSLVFSLPVSVQFGRESWAKNVKNKLCSTLLPLVFDLEEWSNSHLNCWRNL